MPKGRRGALLLLEEIRAELKEVEQQGNVKCIAKPRGVQRCRPKLKDKLPLDVEALEIMSRAFEKHDAITLMTAFICEKHYSETPRRNHYIQLFEELANQSSKTQSSSIQLSSPVDLSTPRSAVRSTDTATPPYTPCPKPRKQAAAYTSPSIKLENDDLGGRSDQDATNRKSYETSHGYPTPRATPPTKSSPPLAEATPLLKPFQPSAKTVNITGHHGETYEALISNCLSAIPASTEITPIRVTISIDLEVTPIVNNHTPNGERPWDPNRTDDAIRAELLKTTHKEEGSVYIMSTPARPGYVKIGRSIDVKRRLKDLRRDCDMPDLKIERDCPLQKTDYHDKLERLVHAELRNFRKTFECDHIDGKHHTHIEWFRVSPEVAAQTVQRWYDFLAIEPYGKYGGLKTEWRRKLSKGRMPYDPTGTEPWDDHCARSERWAEWIWSTE